MLQERVVIVERRLNADHGSYLPSCGGFLALWNDVVAFLDCFISLPGSGPRMRGQVRVTLSPPLE